MKEGRCFMSGEHSCEGIYVTQMDVYQGEPSLRIATPLGTYIYHLEGAGFASLIDPDGSDWLSYRPSGGSAGHYRGVPNLIYPEGGFHPGGALKSETRWQQRARGCVVIDSRVDGGAWHGRWEVHADHATFTVLAAAHSYWFLYEGTPGGRLNTNTGYVLRPGQEVQSLGERWEAPLPAPAWVAFGDTGSDYLLYVVHHQRDRHEDSYRPMNGEMTVFGFGRSLTELRGLMERVPNRFSIGLLPTRGLEPAALKNRVGEAAARLLSQED